MIVAVENFSSHGGFVRVNDSDIECRSCRSGCGSLARTPPRHKANPATLCRRRRRSHIRASSCRLRPPPRAPVIRSGMCRLIWPASSSPQNH
jgi:hypothetical protein